MASFNYSKWDNIELSDDESDCHPNIEKVRWKEIEGKGREGPPTSPPHWSLFNGVSVGKGGRGARTALSFDWDP